MGESQEARPIGRPSSYTAELAAEICQRLADGESLRSVCRSESMPSMSTIMRWAAEKPEFQEQYAKARSMLLEHHAEEIIEIADDGTNDWMEKQDKDGANIGWQVNGEHIQRSRLRVDTRKWVLSKLLPKVYGDKSSVEMTGKDGAPLVPKQPSNLELAREIVFLLDAGLREQKQTET